MHWDPTQKPASSLRFRLEGIPVQQYKRRLYHRFDYLASSVGSSRVTHHSSLLFCHFPGPKCNQVFPYGALYHLITLLSSKIERESTLQESGAYNQSARGFQNQRGRLTLGRSRCLEAVARRSFYRVFSAWPGQQPCPVRELAKVWGARFDCGVSWRGIGASK